MRSGKRLSFSLGVNTIVFQAESFVILAHTQECIGTAYTGECIYIYSDSQAALQALEALSVTSKLVWECWQALCALSSRNKVTLLWVPGHCGIQSNKDADALATEESSNSFLGPEPSTTISPCVGRLKVKEWLKERHSEHWAAAPGMKQSKHFIGRPSDNKLSRDLMDLDRKQCRPATGLLTATVH
jgi:hypothetical protein